MRKTALAFGLLLTALPAAAQPQRDYRAVGTEPFWSLTIGARTMRFEAPGRTPVIERTPKVIVGFAGEMWRTRRISASTLHKQCSDGMSDRIFPDTVTVTVDGRRYQGCGGTPIAAPVPAVSPIEGSWRIEYLNRNPVARGTSPALQFEGDRISGNAGCNRFSGRFTFARGRIVATPLAVTEMACIDQTRNRQEQAVLSLLAERLTISSNRGGKLVLTGTSGRAMTLVRARP